MKAYIRSSLLKTNAIAFASALSFFTTFMSASSFAAEFQPQFKDTEISEFVTTVGKSLRKTMIIDPNVRGKINIRSYDVLTSEQYYQFFLNVLDVYGFSAVEVDNNVIKVIKSKDAKTSAIPVVSSENPGFGDTMVTRVVEVKNVTVRELVPLLRQLSDNGGGGNVVNYDPANVIMITGTAAVVNRLVKIIERVDRAGDKDVQIIKLKYASAGDMVRIIEAMSKSAANGKGATPSFLIPKIVADDRTNSVIVSGERKARERITNLISRLDSELESNGNTRVYYLKYSQAADLVPVLQGVSETIAEEAANASGGNSGGGRQSASRNISIDAHADTNTLVITAEPDLLRSLEAVIRQLDVRRAQVLVEAIIVEVFESDGASLGVQLYSSAGGFTQFTNGNASISSVGAAAISGRGEDGDTTTSITGDTITTITTNDEEDDFSLLAGILSSVSGGFIGGGNDDFGAILQAVSSDTNSNILATPSITTLDNQEASFIVGQEIPILTGSTSSSNNGNPFQTVERQEVGIKLKVTPQVNEGSGVQLTIEQEVSSVSGATGVDISINKREIKTTVMADDGGMVVLGGLIDEDVQESVQKIPLLGDLPLIGALFRSTSNTIRKRNLMVFLRATIIRDAAHMAELTKEKYNYIRADELLRQEAGLTLLDDDDLPLLPEWNDDLTLPPSFKEYSNDKNLDVIDTNKDTK